ncbi:MAG: (Fe-S)-binding protein [Deltaproteobacteria bacterium]|nr:(Fe-S)-binding protein [Deltaproteobacteria bacterium]
MPSQLPLVDAHEKEHTYCTFCPKLCRHACPVATVEGRETTTPWAKMAALHHVANGNLPHTDEVAATWWACTGCMRCKTFCDHDNEVAVALGAGRAEALSRGTAPRAARELRETHRGRVARASAAAAAIFGDSAESSSKATSTIAYAPGCTACVTAPEEARAGLLAVEGLTKKSAAVLGGRCCGLPLLDAGDPDGFLRAARAFIDDAGGARRVVFLDPGCLHALRVLAPALDPTFPSFRGESRRDSRGDAPELLHLSELAAENLDSLSVVAVTAGSVRYHDPCRLGRGLGVYDAPREVLTRVLGRRPEELHQTREHAECSGAGGQLPRTSPESAQAIAKERHADNELAGGGAIVSPCPASRRAFEKAGTRALSFATLLAASAGPVDEPPAASPDDEKLPP